MVIRVEFTDGTVYDDEPVFLALEAYFQELEIKIQRSEVDPKRRRYDKP